MLVNVNIYILILSIKPLKSSSVETPRAKAMPDNS